MDIKSVINDANQKLKEKKISSYLLDTEILMSKVIKKKRDYVILNSEEELNCVQVKHFKELLEQRLKGKPISYITGKKDFWKYEFNIEDGVLIPRPDSELIIEQILKISKNKSKLQVLEAGIGSGCLLLSVLKEKKDFMVLGSI